MSSSGSARKHASICTAVLFLITGLSGLILVVVHPAHGAGMSHASIMIKHIHEIAAVPFLIAALVHACFNRKILARYFS